MLVGHCEKYDGKKCLSVLVFVPVPASQVAVDRKYARVAAFALDSIGLGGWAGASLRLAGQGK